MLWNKKNLPHRILSGFLALIYILVTVLSPIGALPVFATQDLVSASYQYKEKEDIEIYMISETGNFTKGETTSIRLFIENNSEETLTEGSLTWNDIHDNFSDAGFVLSEKYENVEISENGYLLNLTLAPGEIFEVEFQGTMADDREAVRNEEIVFQFYGAKAEKEISKRAEFRYVRNLINLFEADFPEGNESETGGTNIVELRLALKDVERWVQIGTDSEEEADMPDSDEKLATDSNSDETKFGTKIATDSNSDKQSERTATDSNAKEEHTEEENTLLVSSITYALATYGVQLEDVTVKSVSTSDEEITAQVEYRVSSDAVPGRYFGSVDAAVKVNGKTYEASQGFELSVEQGLSEEELAQVQRVIEMIDRLPDPQEVYEIAAKYMEAEDYEAYEAYAQEIASIAWPAWNAYNALSEKQQALVTNIDRLMDSSWIWSAVTLEENVSGKISDTERPVNENINITLYNYGTKITEDDSGHLKFYHSESYGGRNIDGFHSNSTDEGKAPKMNLLLDKFPQGTFWNTTSPMTTERLFSKNNDGSSYENYKSASDEKSNYVRFSVEMGNDGGLFEKDKDGYLIYDSGKNAATFTNQKNGVEGNYGFDVYNYTVRPNHMTSKVESFEYRTGNFLPFNDSAAISTSPILSYEYDDTTYNNYVLNESTDLWFGMLMEIDFYMPKDGKINGQNMVFEFEGDDDVWVYVDDVLVLDIGGTHGAQKGSVDFATGEVTNPTYIISDKDSCGVEAGGLGSSIVDGENKALTTLKDIFSHAYGAESGKWDSFEKNSKTFEEYTVHNLKFYYMERGGNISFCRLKFNMPTLPQGSLMVGKELGFSEGLSESAKEYAKQDVEYTFVVKDQDGNVMFADTKVPLVDASGNKIEDQMVSVNKSGEFKLKADQKVLFTGINPSETRTYYIEERIPKDVEDQYEAVCDKSGNPIIKVEQDPNLDYVSYQIGPLSGDVSNIVLFKNQVDVEQMGELAIEKKIQDGTDGHGEVFYFEVLINGKPISEVVPFTLEEAGVESTTKIYPVEMGDKVVVGLKAGQKVTMDYPLIAGTEYSVRELGTEDWELVSYEHDSYTKGTEDDTATALDVEGDGEDAGGSLESGGSVESGGSEESGENVEAGGSVVPSGTVKPGMAYLVTATNRKLTTSLTLDKNVAGNMGDLEKEFTFIVAYETKSGIKETEVSLSHNDDPVVIDGIPMGSVVTITEGLEEAEQDTKYEVKAEVTLNGAKGDGAVITDQDTANDHVFKFNADNSDGYAVVFTNTKNAIVDTGITLDSLPYILILAAVIAGVVVFVVRKRKEDDFE